MGFGTTAILIGLNLAISPDMGWKITGVCCELIGYIACMFSYYGRGK